MLIISSAGVICSSFPLPLKRYNVSLIFLSQFMPLDVVMSLTLSWRRLLSYRNQCRANQWTGFYMITASAMKGSKDAKEYFLSINPYMSVPVSWLDKLNWWGVEFLFFSLPNFFVLFELAASNSFQWFHLQSTSLMILYPFGYRCHLCRKRTTYSK